MVSVVHEEEDDKPSVQGVNGPWTNIFTATEMGTTYVSNHPEVLAVQEKSGYTQAKEPGTATITVDN